MDRELTEEQQQLAGSARSFLGHHVSLEEVAKTEDDPSPDPLGLWARCVELGWAGLLVPASLGGAGAGLTDAAVVGDALGRALAPTPFVSVLAGVAALCAASARDAAAAFLQAAATGGQRPVLAASGPDGTWSAEGPPVTAADGRLTGDLDFVSAGTGPGPLLVPSAGSEGPHLFAVDVAQPTVEVSPRCLMGGSPLASVRLRGAHATDLGVASDAVQAGLDTAAVLHAAWCAGASERLLEDTVAYVTERYQFGVPIGSFQSVQHRLADAAITNAEATTLARTAARAADGGSPAARRLASSAFVRATEGFVRVARDAHQVWGGMGYSTEAHVHLFSRRAKVAQHEWGGPDLHLDIVAGELAAERLLLHRYLPRLGRM